MKYLIIVVSLMLCGCTTLKWKHNPDENESLSWPESYNYYVIDPNSDIPDAYFVNLEEAKKYKLEYIKKIYTQEEINKGFVN